MNEVICKTIISTVKSRMLLLFIFLALGLQSIETAGTGCNDQCLSKTICVATDGSLSCSKNTLVQVRFNIIDNGTDFKSTEIEMSLVGKNVMSTIPWNIAVQLVKSTTKIVYLCKKNAQGNATSQVNQDSQSIESGSSSYINGDLSCTWSLSMGDPAWPMANGKPVDLFNDNMWRVELRYGGSNYVAASDTSQIPFYRRQYLKCCNLFYGNNDYQLFTKQTKDLFSYYAQAVGSSQPNATLSVIFGSSKAKQLTIDCLFQFNNLSAQLITRTGSEDVGQFLNEQSVNQLDCLWSQPVLISGKSGSFDLSKEVASLQILSDGELVFKATLSSSSSTITSNFMYIYLFTLISLFTRSFSPLN
uniref:CUB-like domain-containing protein n=1 Tax=Tetranychus urticae TaxID=32264 RepID=T1KZB0_TETUR